MHTMMYHLYFYNIELDLESDKYLRWSEIDEPTLQQFCLSTYDGISNKIDVAYHVINRQMDWK